MICLIHYRDSPTGFIFIYTVKESVFYGLIPYSAKRSMSLLIHIEQTDNFEAMDSRWYGRGCGWNGRQVEGLGM